MTLGNLPYKRYVAQVSSGAPQLKSNWVEMMSANLEALTAPQWREAADVAASLADHDFTAATHFNDAYDAFKMSGNYDSSAMTEVAYAGMAAYRFTLPADYVSGSANITSVAVPVYRDRFCKGGVRVAVAFGGESPSFITWGVARGEGSDVPAKTAMMSQAEVPYLTASTAADDVAEFTVPAIANKSRYLWVVVTLEDYTDRWVMYNKREERLYAVEGSARLAGERMAVTFDSDVTADGPAHEFAVVRGGVVPRLPEGSASGARVLELFRDGSVPSVAFTETGTNPSYTVFQGGGVAEFFGQAADVNVSIPFTLNGVEKRVIGVCGAFDRASVPGIPGFVLLDGESGQVLQATVSGTIGATYAALLHTASSKVGVTIDSSGSAPVAKIFAADATQFTFGHFMAIDLSTMVATPSDYSGLALKEFQSGEVPVRFYDQSLRFYAGNVDYGGNIPVALITLRDFSGSYGAVKRVMATPVLGGPGNITASVYTVADFYGDENLSIESVSVAGNRNGENISASFAVCGTFSEIRRELGGGELIYSGSAAQVRVDGASGSGVFQLLASVTPLDVGIPALPLTHVDQVEYGGTKYLVYGNFYEAGGDPSLRHAFEYDAEMGTRTAISTPTPPLRVFARGDGYGIVRPRAGTATTDYYMGADVPGTIAAADSAIGLRTLQARFYLGELANVARATRARLGASFSVRAGTAALTVVRDGAAAVEQVPVWRMSATALVVPFALPTTWPASALRLDWSDWTGTATAGAEFRAWLRVGEFVDTPPEVLASDVPWDGLAAAAGDWKLLATIPAGTTPATATVALPPIAGAKVATLMLTAFASADGINPAAGTTWPIGAATEVDVVGGEVVNADAAWLPDVTLVG